MFVNGYTFYGNANQSQGSLISDINTVFDPPIPEIEGGMCYMLSIQFLLDYLNGHGASTPQQVFDQITGDSIYLRQIAGGFREYMQRGFPNLSADDTTIMYVDELSQHNFRAAFVNMFDVGHLPATGLTSPAEGHLILFYFKNADGSKKYGHAVAVVRDAANYYLYDPNFGVYQTQNPDDIYAGVLPNLYNEKYLHGYQYSVS